MLAVVSVSVASLLHIAVVALAGSARLLLENRQCRLIVQRALSLLLVLVALWLLASTAR